jgi:hypothetical protein
MTGRVLHRLCRATLMGLAGFAQRTIAFVGFGSRNVPPIVSAASFNV